MAKKGSSKVAGVNENPSQVHGRINEALHVVGYSYARAVANLKWILQDDRWRTAGEGFDDIHVFLASLQPPRDLNPADRKELAQLIKAAEPKVSQRRIAGALGVSEATVARDMGKNRGATYVAPDDAEPSNGAGPESPTATYVAPPTPELTGEEAAEVVAKKQAASATREAKRSEKLEQLEDTAALEAKAVAGVYDVVVIDPPWPMEKIERDERPHQVAFDYPTMAEDEIRGHVESQAPFADDCHVWLWTTHRFLPMALRLIDAWGLKYVCTFVWRKPGGFQPVGLPQYNCEFALYARRGAPIFVDTKQLPTCFEAPRTGHSEKPEEFYGLVRRVTGGRRLDMFNRREIDGFDGYGKEAVG